MGEQGKVLSVDGQFVKVSLMRTEACAKCKMCTAGFSEKEMILTAKNLCAAKEGNLVNIEIDNGNFLKAVLIMYGIPCLCLVGGFTVGYFAVGHSLHNSRDIIAFVSGIIAMALCYFIIKLNENKFKKAGYTPVATEILSER